MGFTRKNDSSGKNILIDTQVLGSSNHPCSQSQWDKQCPGRSPNQAHSSPGQQSGCRPFQRYHSKHVGHFYRLPPRETTQKVYMQICKKINFQIWDEVIHWELKLLKSYVYICMHGNCYIYTMIPNRNKERKNHPWQQHTVLILYIYICKQFYHSKPSWGLFGPIVLLAHNDEHAAIHSRFQKVHREPRLIHLLQV